MTEKYNFENSLSENMPLPKQDVAIYSLNAGLAALVRTLNDESPGLADKLLRNFDKVYAQNEGNPDFQLAFAQLAAMTKMIAIGKQ